MESGPLEDTFALNNSNAGGGGCYRNPADVVIQISVNVRHTGKLSRQEPRAQGEGKLERIGCSHSLNVNAKSFCRLS